MRAIVTETKGSTVKTIRAVFGKEAVLSVVPRHFERWTIEEEARLRAAFVSHQPLGEIANGHLRTPTAILLKLRSMGFSINAEQREEAAIAQQEIWRQLGSTTLESANPENIGVATSSEV